MAATEEPASKRLKTEEDAAPDMEVDDAPPAPTAAKQQLQMSMREMMKMYYGRLFPFKHMQRWLAYGNDSKHAQADASFFQKREFCFTLDGDIFVRFQSFKDGVELADAVKFKCPMKIDIGAVYTKPPNQRALYSGVSSGADRFAPIERELVFDIDLTDYDDVRTCCKEGGICCRCWTFMAAAVQVLDVALREDLGFRHILWVYSGRRGVHCWVCDQRARQMNDEQRTSVAHYLSIFKGVDKDRANVVNTLVLHPAVERAYKILKRAWEESILPEQQLLADEEQWKKVLRYIPDDARKAVTDTLTSKWNGRRHKSDEDINVVRWRDLEAEITSKIAQCKRQNNELGNSLTKCLREMVLAHTYPRLDIEVSKKTNHLLKAPFCIHPKTGKVCVPIDPDVADEFNPETVMTVQQLLTELQEGTLTGTDDWRQTSLASCIELFENKFLNELKVSVNAALAEKARTVAQTARMDW